MNMIRNLLVGGLAMTSAFAVAGNITVTTPRANDFLGTSNTLRFLLTGAVVQSTVRAVIVNDANPLISFTVQNQFSPDAENRVNGTLPLNFSQSTPQGSYTITVTVTEPGNPYPVTTIENVTIDVVAPKFLDVNPVNGAFVRGNVPIQLSLLETFIKEWRVQVNGQDIPNNTGTTNNVNVNWDTSNITNDGSQTINIRVEDEANNSANRSISVTLDRVAPNIQIIAPSGSPIRPNAVIPVSININDQFGGSVTVPAVDVVAQRMDGSFLQRVARVSSRNNGTTLNWTGRIRRTNGFPNPFKLVVTAVDRAGNPAVTQEVVVRLR